VIVVVVIVVVVVVVVVTHCLPPALKYIPPQILSSIPPSLQSGNLMVPMVIHAMWNSRVFLGSLLGV